jgi:hypothetical protein
MVGGEFEQVGRAFGRGEDLQLPFNLFQFWVPESSPQPCKGGLLEPRATPWVLSP